MREGDDSRGRDEGVWGWFINVLLTCVGGSNGPFLCGKETTHGGGMRVCGPSILMFY